jgi:uncharacterized DUF497 family protein
MFFGIEALAYYPHRSASRPVLRESQPWPGPARCQSAMSYISPAELSEIVPDLRALAAVETSDRGHQDTEERFAMLAMVEGRLLFVSYTLKRERLRIISARKAEPHERRRYHNENREI